MKSFITALAAVALTATTLSAGVTPAVAAPSAPADRAGDRFETFLRSIDVLLTPAQLVAAWPDVRERLQRAAGEEDRDLWTRSRAITILGAFPEAATRQTLERLASDPNPTVRRHATYTVARTFGVPGDAGLVALVVARTQDVDDVRQHAVRALRWVDHPEAGRALATLSQRSTRPGTRALAKTTAERRAARLRRR